LQILIHNRAENLKIAVTADIHLTSRTKHPERFRTLERLFRDVIEAGISQLIIAGDCFDKNQSNYHEWDALCGKSEFNRLNLTMIPGNHDALITSAHFASSNVNVYTEPVLMPSDTLMSLPILFVPYLQDRTMGEILAGFKTQLKPRQWILIGHGDWSDGLKTGNPYEPGIYMPLSRYDLDLYQPRSVILGHIHKPTDSDRVAYPGSPCPLDILETGRRRYLVLDTENGEVTSSDIHSEALFFNETFIVFPGQDEFKRLKTEMTRRIDSWRLQPHEKDICRIRIQIKGITSDKNTLAALVQDVFQPFRFYRDETPDLSELFVNDDSNLEKLAQLAIREADVLNFNPGPYDPDRESVILQALKTVYGET